MSDPAMPDGRANPRLDDWIGYRRWLSDRLRGLLLPLFSAPLWLDVPIEVAKGDARGLIAAGLGIGLPLLAVSRLRRGRRGDTQTAAVLTGVATGLAAGLGADYGAVMSLLLGGGAWLGTRLLYDGAFVEAEPPAPPVPPEPEPALIAEARERLVRVQEAAQRLADPRLQGVAGAMGGVLDDLRERPDRLPQARRFLNVHLDGLDRIVDRLEAGAEPPERLPLLLDELDRTARELRERLRHEETEALDVQVKVMSDRLRQEGYG